MRKKTKTRLEITIFKKKKTVFRITDQTYEVVIAIELFKNGKTAENRKKNNSRRNGRGFLSESLDDGGIIIRS